MPLNRAQKLKDKKIAITKTDEKIQYSEVLSMSLLLYAQKDKNFAQVLKNMIHNIPRVKEICPPKDFKESAVILLPGYRDIALRRAEWLVESITNRKISGYEEAISILSSWAKDETIESPKQVIIGLVGLAIPGVTLGIISKKISMAFIINHKLINNSKLDLARKATQASHGILSGALVMAGGDFKKVEPEIVDWFFGDKSLQFYSADAKKINKIKKELKEMNIIYEAIERKGETAMLAVSPVANSNCQEMYWNLKPLEI